VGSPPEARAREIAEGPADAAVLAEAWEDARAMPPAVSRAFDEAFLAAARETPERQSAWIRAIRSAIEDDLRVLLQHIVPEWPEERDPFEAWRIQSPLEGGPEWDLLSRALLLLDLDLSEGTRALDDLSCPWLTRDALFVRFRGDRAGVEELIRVAPAVFDAHGNWVPERHVAPLFAAELIARPDVQAGDAPFAWMVHAFRLLLRRPDGPSIALGYLGRLAYEALTDTRQLQADQEGKPWRSPWAESLEALVTALRDASIDIAQVRDTSQSAERFARESQAQRKRRREVGAPTRHSKGEREGEGARTLYGRGLPYLYGAAVLLGERPLTHEEADRLWSWFEDLLVGRDPGLSVVQRSAGEIQRRIGAVLSCLRDPQGALCLAYKRLEPQRRRSAFGVRYARFDRDLESITLLRVGLYAAASLIERESRPERTSAARALFHWIYERARHLWLTAVLDTADTKRHLVTSCFAFLPHLHADDLPAALKATLPPIADDLRLLAEACANLRLNGIEPERLRVVVAEAGADLDATLRDAHQWSELTGRAKDFPDHLRKLAAELHLDLSRPAVPPGGE
jgi:hypothetical protein